MLGMFRKNNVSPAQQLSKHIASGQIEPVYCEKYDSVSGDLNPGSLSVQWYTGYIICNVHKSYLVIL